MSSTVRRAALVIALSVWAVLVISGAFVMFTYGSTPGEDAQAPLHWPNQTLLARSPDTYTLLLFAHPRCPCTRASMEQLQRILAAAHLPVETYIVFTIPEGASEDWLEGPLLRRAEAVPEFRIRKDYFATETQRFEVATSGHVLLYEPTGRLVFNGGITASRGHEGDCIGSQAVIELLNGMRPAHDETAVYGCPLLNSATPCESCDGSEGPTCTE